MAGDRYFGRACKTCRRRGRGCDRRLPSCNTCESGGQTCEGYLHQWPGLASRGQFVGKSIPVPGKKKRRRVHRAQQTICPSSPQSTSPKPLQTPTNNDDDVASLENGFQEPFDPMQFFCEALNTNSSPQATAWSNEFPILNDFAGSLDNPQGTTDQESFLEPHMSQESGPLDFSHIMNPSLDLFNIPDELGFIMQYHICEVVPKLCVDNLSTENPYRDYILPLAAEVPSLLYACAALAACHFNVRLCTNQFERDFFRFKGKAMKRLQEDLYSKSRATHPGTLATILMLCLCDLCHGGISHFDSHFEGAKRLIELRQERTIGSFVEQYLAWLDVMAAASHPRGTVFSSQDINAFLGDSGDRWGLDAIPCPSDQFQIIYEIVSLYKNQLDPDCPSLETMAQVEEIKQRLLQRPVRYDRGQNWLHMTEAYRFAIVLYLLRLFSCEIDEFELNWLLSSVLYHARATPPASGWSDQLLWPLFHAGLELKDTTSQEWVRERARCMQTSGGFGNVQSALTLLEGVWKGERPAKYIDLMLGKGSGTVLLI